MFFDERFQSVHFKKSSILNLIWFLQTMWFAISLFIIPIYLYQIFKSWEIIWQINSFAWLMWILATLLISFLLTKFERWTNFKIATFSILTALIWFIFISNYIEAIWYRSFLMIWWVITWSVLSLYLKDISELTELSKNQWKFQVSKNIAWLIWPVSAWFLFDFVEKNKEFLINLFQFLGNWKNLEYYTLFASALFFFILSFFVFLYWKFIIKHPHLQQKPHSKKINSHHHYSKFEFIWEYFQNKYRTLSFLNIMFLNTWFAIWYSFWFIILLEQFWIPKSQMWIFFWLLWLPLILIEWFLDKFIKKLWSSLNVLIFWYWFFITFISLSFFVWFDNFYLFVWLYIFAHIWIATVEPLQEYQYYEWVNKKNQEKFYSIHSIWWAIARLVAPVLFWIWIAEYWILKTFYFLPWLLFLFFIWLLIFKFWFYKK